MWISGGLGHAEGQMVTPPLPWEPVPGQDNPLGREIFPHIQLNLPWGKLGLFPPVFNVTWEKRPALGWKLWRSWNPRTTGARKDLQD